MIIFLTCLFFNPYNFFPRGWNLRSLRLLLLCCLLSHLWRDGAHRPTASRHYCCDTMIPHQLPTCQRCPGAHWPEPTVAPKNRPCSMGCVQHHALIRCTHYPERQQAHLRKERGVGHFCGHCRCAGNCIIAVAQLKRAISYMLAGGPSKIKIDMHFSHDHIYSFLWTTLVLHLLTWTAQNNGKRGFVYPGWRPVGLNQSSHIGEISTSDGGVQAVHFHLYLLWHL